MKILVSLGVFLMVFLLMNFKGISVSEEKLGLVLQWLLFTLLPLWTILKFRIPIPSDPKTD